MFGDLSCELGVGRVVSMSVCLGAKGGGERERTDRSLEMTWRDEAVVE